MLCMPSYWLHAALAGIGRRKGTGMALQAAELEVVIGAETSDLQTGIQGMIKQATQSEHGCLLDAGDGDPSRFWQSGRGGG